MMSSTRAPFTAASALILAAAPAYADSTGFQGFYAPDTWTIAGTGIGGSSATFAPDGSELELIGSDGGFSSTISVTHPVIESGTWSFHWTYGGVNISFGFDTSYYTINGVKFLIAVLFDGSLQTGRVSVPVTAGQVIGWQIDSGDGVFGPGILTVTDFRAPVPSAAALALLSLAALPRARCRR